MAVIRLPQPYANNHASMQNIEALQTLGEEAIFLTMYHENVDAGIQPRCSVCFDERYNQGDKYKCPTCYGTTFEGGVKRAGRVWCIFGDAVGKEDFNRRGVWNQDQRAVQLEVTPIALEHDYIIRVRQWSDTHVPLYLGERYVVDEVQIRSVRTGSRYGQVHGVDHMGQMSIMSKVDPNHPIQLYTVSTEEPVARFEEPLSYGIEMMPYQVEVLTSQDPDTPGSGIIVPPPDY